VDFPEPQTSYLKPAKMKTLTIQSFLILSLGLLIFSCKKDDEPQASREILIAGESSKSWKITGAQGTLQNQEYSSFMIDFYNDNKIYAAGQEIPSALIPEEFADIPTFPACAKDNIIVFSSDKTYETNEGATPCSEESQFILTHGTWVLSADEKTLTLNDNSGVEIKYTLTDLTEQTMEGENSGSFVIQGTTTDYILTTTFTAQ